MATVWYSLQQRRVNGTRPWETRLRTRAANGEQAILAALREAAESEYVTLEFRAIEGFGMFENPTWVLGVRNGVWPEPIEEES